MKRDKRHSPTGYNRAKFKQQATDEIQARLVTTGHTRPTRSMPSTKGFILRIFTDGSYRPRENRIIWAFLATGGGEVLRRDSGAITGQGYDSAYAEALAIHSALQWVGRFRGMVQAVRLSSDCDPIVKAINAPPGRYMNAPSKVTEIRTLLTQLRSHFPVTIEHVSRKQVQAAHELCDQKNRRELEKESVTQPITIKP